MKRRSGPWGGLSFCDRGGAFGPVFDRDSRVRLVLRHVQINPLQIVLRQFVLLRWLSFLECVASPRTSLARLIALSTVFLTYGSDLSHLWQRRPALCAPGRE